MAWCAPRPTLVRTYFLSFILLAWLAGDGNPHPQSFDVWVAFEFPSFETYSTPKPPTVLSPGQYVVRFPEVGNAVLSLHKEDPTDGTPVVGLLPHPSSPQRVTFHDSLFVQLHMLNNLVVESLPCSWHGYVRTRTLSYRVSVVLKVAAGRESARDGNTFPCKHGPHLTLVRFFE